MIKHSATLAINEKIAARRRQGEQVVHLGFGEAGLPVLPSVTQAPQRAVAQNAYSPVVGSPPAREAAAGYSPPRPAHRAAQVIFSLGSKALLHGVLGSVPGDLVLPAPSWVTHAAALTGKRVVSVPIPAAAGGCRIPSGSSRPSSRPGQGADPRILVLTLPDNPTGTSAGADLVKRVCEIADGHDLVMLSDEIYPDLIRDAVLGPATRGRSDPHSLVTCL